MCGWFACVYAYAHVDIKGHLLEVSLSFHYVDTKDQTQVIRLGGACLYWLSQLSNFIYLYEVHEYLFKNKENLPGNGDACL